jgi:hypothetical protein
VVPAALELVIAEALIGPVEPMRRCRPLTGRRCGMHNFFQSP